MSGILYELDNFHPALENKILHIGLIPDGTGRWAIKKHIEIFEAYKISMKKISNFISLCYEEKIVNVSIYLSSIHNFKRSQKRIDAFCDAQVYLCKRVLPLLSEELKASFKAVGNLNILPNSLRNAFNYIGDLSRENTDMQVFLCAAYNPFEEINNAIERTKNPMDLPNNLWVPIPLDIVIRTGGDNVLSNFLPLQSAYARFYFLNKHFPEVGKSEYKNILSDYLRLDRHYGE